MIRVLDALKEAEQQKSTTLSASEPEHIDSIIAEKVQGEEVPASEIPSQPRNALSISPCLEFEELQQRCAKPGWKLDADSNVFINRPSFAPCAEQFRTLRSRLYRFRGLKPIRTILVTSTVAGEGKTFVALNLAQAMVQQNEQPALLIDADLRISRMHVVMGAPVALGLTDYLRGEADEFSIIQSNSQNNLFFIPAGNQVANPAELLANRRLRTLVDRLAPLFDWVIFDAPPVLPVSDTSILGELCDGVIMVVHAGSTAFDLAQMACQEFRANLLGVVLNRAEEEAKKYADYAYYGVKR
jgi:capsular exopolysaccharide synthesis family protein